MQHVHANGLDFANSPLQGKIKRLGSATDGRFGETLTQATVVENLIGYITTSAVKDRDDFLHGRKPRRASPSELVVTPFRNMFLEERDLDIADILKPAYRSIARLGDIPSQDAWLALFQKVRLDDADFTVESFEPGTSGETKLFRRLLEDTGVVAG